MRKINKIESLWRSTAEGPKGHRDPNPASPVYQELRNVQAELASALDNLANAEEDNKVLKREIKRSQEPLWDGTEPYPPDDWTDAFDFPYYDEGGSTDP